MLARLFATAVLSYAFLQPADAANSADKFRRLNAPEIRARVIGRVITDESHWSDDYDRDGALKAVDLGVTKTGTWKLVGKEMCVVRKGKVSSSECFEIWMHDSETKYRRDGITLTGAVLRDE